MQEEEGGGGLVSLVKQNSPEPVSFEQGGEGVGRAELGTGQLLSREGLCVPCVLGPCCGLSVLSSLLVKVPP